MNTAVLKDFFRKYWFRLAIVLVALLIVLKKDLSFQVRLKAPVGTENQVDSREESIPVQREGAGSSERLSDNLTPAELSETTERPVVDRFDFSSIKGGNNGRPAIDELSSIGDDKKRAFMERFAHVTVSERRKYGIPSSLILANALLISRSGQRDMARSGNNFFAIPCTSDWQGASGNYQGSCYRHYKNAWTSFRDHSLFLTTGKLAYLRQLEDDDYRAWARELEKAGFYEEPRMAKQIINLIEGYKLYELDRK